MKKKETTNEIARPPVIAVLGHVDHGKSTLLDYIRKTNTTDKESGGITQHIAAYEITHKTKEGALKKITFIDTPGHEAFSNTRSRGVYVADVAILVVSAEDGVKPQTLEAYKLIVEKGLPMIVAITKTDSAKANVEKAKQSLAENEIYLEGYGGAVPWVGISSVTGDGINELLDLALISGELNDLKGNEAKNAEGVVIESNLDTRAGISATLVIKDGTLKKSMFVAIGESVAPVRMMEDHIGKKIDSASFSSPIRLTGFNKLPEVGIKFHSFNKKKDVEQYLSNCESSKKSGKKLSAVVSEKIKIPILIKADTQGTLDAIFQELGNIKSEKVEINAVNSGVGNISENDIKLVMGKEKPVIYGFRVKLDNQAKIKTDRGNIEVHTFDVIYKLLESIKNLVLEREPKIETEEIVGVATILKTFSKNKDKQIVGGKVDENSLLSGSEVKIVRRGLEIGKGKLKELQQQKVKSSEVNKGSEFGALIDSKIELTRGDKIQSFKTVSK